MSTCLDWRSVELKKLADEVGVEATPAFADKVGTLMDKLGLSELPASQEINFAESLVKNSSGNAIKLYRGYAMKEDRPAINLDETIGKTASDYIEEGFYFTESIDEAKEYAYGRTDKYAYGKPSRHYTGDFAKISEFNILAPNGVLEFKDINAFLKAKRDNLIKFDLSGYAIKLNTSTLGNPNSAEWFVKDRSHVIMLNDVDKLQQQLPTASQLKEYLDKNKPSDKIVVNDGEAKVNPQGLSHAEVYLPAWTKKFFAKEFQDKNGEVDFEAINKMMPEVMDMIGYRIPTEDKYSMLPLKVVGFLPSSEGGSIMLPAEITTIAGSDFDVDKMYVMFKNIVRNRGRLQVEKYMSEDNSTVQERKEAYANRLPEAQKIRLSYKERLDDVKNAIKEYKELSKLEEYDINELVDASKDVAMQWTNLDKEIDLLTNPSQNTIELYNSKGITDLDEYVSNLIDELDDIKNDHKNINARISELREAGKVESGGGTKSKLQQLYEKKAELYAKQQEEINNLISDEDFNKIPIPEQNTKTARDNALIDINRGILQNPSTAQAIFNPGGYSNLKDEIAKNINEKLGVGKTKPNSIFNANHVDLMTVQNTAGRNLKGIAASHNSFRALLQHSNIKLTSPLKFDGKEFTDLSGNSVGQKSTDGRSITRNVSEILAASVDNGKDPLLASINYNEHTADLVFMMLSLGIDPMTVFAFINQPSIRRAVEMVYMGDSSGLTYALQDIYKEVAGVKEFKLNKGVVESYSKNALMSSLSNTSNRPNFIMTAINYIEQSQAFSKVVQASKADTAGMGKFVEEGISLKNAIIEAKNVELALKPVMTGIINFLDGDGDNKMTNDFTEYGVTKPIESVISKMFPYSNNVFTKIKDRISKELGRQISANDAKRIDKHIVQFFTSGFGFYALDQRIGIVQNTPKHIQTYKEIWKNELANNELFNRLSTETDRKTGFVSIVFDNTLTTSEEQKDNVRMAWEEMIKPQSESALLEYIKSGNKIPKEIMSEIFDAKTGKYDLRKLYNYLTPSKVDLIREPWRDFIKNDNVLNSLIRDYFLNRLAANLIRYSFYMTGHAFTPKSISSLIPMNVYINLEEGEAGSMKLMDKIQSLINRDVTDSEIEEFLNQFYKHYYSESKFVPKAYTGKNANIDEITNSKIVVHGDSNLIVWVDNTAMPKSKYVVNVANDDIGEVTRLYKYNSKLSSDFELVFTRVNKLGIPDQVFEFDINGAGEKSVIDSNNYTQEQQLTDERTEGCAFNPK